MTKHTPKGSQDKPFPPIPKALLERLEEIFPSAIPSYLVEPQQFAVLVGQQKVMEKLRTEFRKQMGNNNLHETRV